MSRRRRAIHLVVGAAAFQLFAVPMVWANTTGLDEIQPEGIKPTQGAILFQELPAENAQPAPMDTDLSTKSDSELTELTARWGNLSPSERRRLLGEVRKRMAASRTTVRPTGVIVQREYGRVVRKSDGSVVVQRRVVQMRAPNSRGAQPESTKPGRRVTFGIGFEQRSRARAPQGESVVKPVAPELPQSLQLPPVITVNKQQTPSHAP